MSESRPIRECIETTPGVWIDPLRAHAAAEGYDDDAVETALAARAVHRVYDPTTSVWSPPDPTDGCAILAEGDRAAFVDLEVATAIAQLADATADASEAAATLREHGATVRIDIDCRLDVGIQADTVVPLEETQ